MTIEVVETGWRYLIGIAVETWPHAVQTNSPPAVLIIGSLQSSQFSGALASVWFWLDILRIYRGI